MINIPNYKDGVAESDLFMLRHEASQKKPISPMDIFAVDPFETADALSYQRSTAEKEPSYTKKEHSSSNKEKHMLNSTLLIRLASAQADRDLREFGCEMPNGLREEIERQVAEERKNDTRAAASEILGLLKSHNRAVESRVNELRQYRNMMNGVKSGIANLNRAKAYGMATQNWIPLAALLDRDFRRNLTGDEKSLAEVPASWTPVVSVADSPKQEMPATVTHQSV